MKKRKNLLALLPILLLFICLTNHKAYGQCGDLYIKGAIDGPLTGGAPKAMQLCATADITDLSIYGVESVANGGGSSGMPEFNFPPDALFDGDCIWVTSDFPEFVDFFGFEACYQETQVNSNGNDTYLLYCSGNLVDALGDPDTDGIGECWDYLDGWISNSTGMQNGGTFDCADYTFSGPNALDGETTNDTAATPFPSPDANCPVQDCSITNVTVMTQGFCSGDDAMYTVCADVIGGSGDYSIVDASLTVLASGSGATAGNICITATATGPTTVSTLDVDFVDDNDNTCIGGSTVTINIPECPQINNCPGAFISEFAYDCDNADMNEGIEICVPNTFTGDLADIVVELYDGGDNETYGLSPLNLSDDFTVGDNDGTNTYYTFAGTGSSIQNGSPDGIALSFQGVNCQFISYEGTMTAANGFAVGVMSIDVGVSQSQSTTCDMSIMFCDGMWQAGLSTFGSGCPVCNASITTFPANGN